MTLARAARTVGFKKCCLRSGRYDGAPRNYYFPRLSERRRTLYIPPSPGVACPRLLSRRTALFGVDADTDAGTGGERRRRLLVQAFQRLAVGLADLVAPDLEGCGEHAVLGREGRARQCEPPDALDGREARIDPVDRRADGPDEIGIIHERGEGAGLPGAAGPGG